MELELNFINCFEDFQRKILKRGKCSEKEEVYCNKKESNRTRSFLGLE